MPTGKVKWFNNQKLYGFIQPDNGGKDIFVHMEALRESGLDTLLEGQAVSYDEKEQDKKGVAAINIKLGN